MAARSKVPIVWDDEVETRRAADSLGSLLGRWVLRIVGVLCVVGLVSLAVMWCSRAERCDLCGDRVQEYVTVSVSVHVVNPMDKIKTVMAGNNKGDKLHYCIPCYHRTDSFRRRARLGEVWK